MKRAFLMILCIVLCFQMTACGLDVGSLQKDKWIEEGAAMLGEDIRSGEFVLGGEVYTFPMALSDWLDRGWHISNRYDNRDSFELEPGYESSEFQLYNENGDYLGVRVINASDRKAKLEECLVSYLDISTLQDINLVLPAGIHKGSTPTDIRGAYGDADIDESSDSFFHAYYNYTTEDDWICQIELAAFDNNYTIDPFSSVTFRFCSTTEWAGFYEKAGGEDGCRRYLNSFLRTCFYGDFSEYVENQFSTQEEAEALHETMVTFYASCLIQYTGINEETLRGETIEEFREIARQVLSRTKWEFVNISFIGDSGSLTIDLYPTDFLDLIDDDLVNVVSELQTKYTEIDINDLSEGLPTEINQDYAEMVLNTIRGRADETQVQSPYSKLYSLDYSEGILSGDDWVEIYSILTDMK